MAGEGPKKAEAVRLWVWCAIVWLAAGAVFLAPNSDLVVRLALAVVVLIPIVLLGQKVALWLVRW